MTRVLAMDPGGTTGWALFEDNKVVRFGNTPQDNFYEWLNSVQANLAPDYIVVEDYLIRPEKLTGSSYTHVWSSGQTIRFIGAVVFYGVQTKIPVTLQQPAIKPVAAKLTGIPFKRGKKGVHHLDAMLHGGYFLITELKVNPRDVRLPGAEQASA